MKSATKRFRKRVLMARKAQMTQANHSSFSGDMYGWRTISLIHKHWVRSGALKGRWNTWKAEKQFRRYLLG